jgi:hypothetical protein
MVDLRFTVVQRRSSALRQGRDGHSRFMQASRVEHGEPLSSALGRSLLQMDWSTMVASEKRDCACRRRGSNGWHWVANVEKSWGPIGLFATGGLTPSKLAKHAKSQLTSVTGSCSSGKPKKQPFVMQTESSLTSSVFHTHRRICHLG